MSKNTARIIPNHWKQKCAMKSSTDHLCNKSRRRILIQMAKDGQVSIRKSNPYDVKVCNELVGLGYLKTGLSLNGYQQFNAMNMNDKRNEIKMSISL